MLSAMEFSLVLTKKKGYVDALFRNSHGKYGASGMDFENRKDKKTDNHDGCPHWTGWRRNGDSNPSALLQAYELSKPAPSTTWVFLRFASFNARVIIGDNPKE